jgi:hypothetical protein
MAAIGEEPVTGIERAQELVVLKRSSITEA